MYFEVLAFETNVNYYFSKEIIGMPLFCFQSKKREKDFSIGAIKFKTPQLLREYGQSKHSKNDRRHPNNVETFYNIDGEKNWIKSALGERENDGVIVKWVYVKKVRKESRSNNSSRFSQILPLWTVLNISLFLKTITIGNYSRKLTVFWVISVVAILYLLLIY